MITFFTTSDQNVIPEIIKILNSKGHEQLESAGKEENLLIETKNKTFWHCSNEVMNQNHNLIKNMGHKLEEITLKDIQKW